uniref:Proliferating cell nuclear antigen PCNA N-terminal domain-containing protein n=1 Tax=Moniliophthora roreri TaxID=221103 RepID=A0A0W0EYN5_MONRR
MTPEHEFLQASFKAVLVLLSGIAFRFSFTPPNNSGNSVSPPRPPLSEGFTALREWFMMAVLLDRAYPIERIFCLVAAINEALFILSTPIPSIRDVLPHLNVSTSINNTSLTPQFITSVLLSIAGGIFRVACYRALGNAFRYDCVPSESPTLVTHGPYSIVRHPSYVASWMAVIGSGLVHLIGGSWIIESGFLNTLIGKAMVYSWWGTFGTAIIGLTMRVGSEDELMKKQFGRNRQRSCQRRKPDDLCTQAKDTSHIAMVSIFLNQSAFARYRCHRAIMIGRSISSFCKLVKATRGDDKLTLRARDEVADALDLVSESAKTRRLASFSLNLLIIDVEKMEIPEVEFDARVRLYSDEFASIIKYLNANGETITIVVSE